MQHMIVCHDPQQAHKVLTGSFWPWLKSMTMAGHKIVVRGEEYENELSDKQRGYLHGVVLTQIAQQAAPNGQRFPMAVWKEHFRATLLGSKKKTVVNPITGKKSRRLVRVSTEDLGVKAYAKYIDQVTAVAATDLGVTITLRFEDYEGPNA
ncbi:recombination protein NinB [Variovorax boronicumulans]|uniref:recombination protein NinB n=1 Tax=Variovorax boronicumulans TaxID=436515 RepID=UPI0012E43155|nr:recombination protein NinB [Variovorax boronicumulans]GER21276.1 hypothetical protein VCH24_63230 [Variovorax boronicumulans]